MSTPSTPHDHLLTVKEAAAQCEVHQKTIRRAIDAGNLACLRPKTANDYPRKAKRCLIRIERSALDAWLGRSRTQANPPESSEFINEHTHPTLPDKGDR